MTGDVLKVRNRASVGQGAPEVCRLISAGPGGAGGAGEQGRAGITESGEEPEILNMNVFYWGDGSPSTNNTPLVEPGPGVCYTGASHSSSKAKFTETSLQI